MSAPVGGATRPRVSAALAAVAVAALATSCGVLHPGLSNSSVSPCFRAIPTAVQALHEPSARMVGVHRVSADKVEARLPPTAGPSTTADDDTNVCAIVFEGHFAPGQVLLAPPTQQGRYAVVLVTSEHLKLVASYVVDHLPEDLGKRLVSAPAQPVSSSRAPRSVEG